MMSYMLSIKTKKLLAVIVFSTLFLVTRIPFLGYDEINPDAVNWHFRSEQFIVGLKSGDFLKTYQHYHPGVTLMWIMGVRIELYRQINPQDRVYTEDNFLIQHQIAKYSLVLVQLALSIGLILALKDILGFRISMLATSIFSFEPFFLGNSRLLHMDILLTLFVILSLTYAYRYYLRCSTALSLRGASETSDEAISLWRYLVLAGVFAGLAFLTKSVGILSLGFISAFFAISTIINRLHGKLSMLYLGVFLLSSVATIFILFPALWVSPKLVLSNIYNEGLRIGTRRGHEQLVMGDTVDVAGPSFYPLVLALKTSPLIWLGVGLFIYLIVKNPRKFQSVDKKFILYLSIFYLIYFVGMTVASKKLDRYMLPLFPLLGIIASIGISQTFTELKGKYYKVALYFSVVLVTGIGVLYPLVKLYPYYFTYTNPLFGSAENANKIIGQKPFGIGIPELKSLLVAKYGKDAPLGFIDKKPMSMIYPNSKLFDIRETGTSKYNLIILGPNEEMPENVTGGKFTFVQDDTMYINGLEFWRIYIHEPKKVI